MGNEQAERVLRGCHVHWTRSLQRVAKHVTNTKEEERSFLHFGRQIPQVADKEKVKKLFRILSRQESILEASEFVDASLNVLLSTTESQGWKKLRSWSGWWCRGNHLQMFTRAYTNLSEKEWEHAPKTTNPVEAINRLSLHQKGCSLNCLLENIYLQDRTHAAKLSATETNVSLSYSSNEEARRKQKSDRRKRKRSSLTKSTQEDDNAPPDKRRNIASGRNLIGTTVAVEFQEESPDGKGAQCLGWLNGTISSYNRRNGYFVTFEGKEVNGKKVTPWSEWLENLDTEDIRFT